MTVIEDYITGMKATMYLSQRKDLEQAGWSGQNPPYKHEDHAAAELPHFGDYHDERVAANKALKMATDPLAFSVPAELSPIKDVDMSKIPSLSEIKGSALHHLTGHMELSTTEHVVATVNDDMCINCGRCMLTCNDTGYQAISFSTETHQVKITDSCTGCGLCGAVCPVAGCIDFAPRETDYNIYRGTTPGPTAPELPVHKPSAWATPGDPVIRSPGYQ